MRPAAAISVFLASSLCACGGEGATSGVDVAPVLAVPGPSPAIQLPSIPTSPPTSGAATWRPQISDTWQWQLRGAIDTSYAVNVYDVDLADAPQSVIDALHARGKKVVCYFSAGSSENFRADYARFKPMEQGKKLDGWEGERWLDVRSANVRSIMRDRLSLAVLKRCDGVEPDNVDGYANDSGFSLTAADQLAYNRFLSDEAHLRNLAVGLKNDLDQVPSLAAYFDFAVNEQCHEFEECDALLPFTRAGKPVLNAEYEEEYVEDENGARTRLCESAKAASLRTLVLPLELDDSFRFSCD